MKKAFSIAATLCLWTLAVFQAPGQTVITNLDPNALNAALQGGGTVTFAVDGTIVLTNAIALSTNVILDGTNHSITLSGGGAVEIFVLQANINVTLRNLTLANGVTNGAVSNSFYPYITPNIGYGGAIYSHGTLNIDQCIFSNNVAAGGDISDSGVGEGSQISGMGGAIYSTGSLTISNTLFVTNSASGGSVLSLEFLVVAGSGLGGAICNIGGTVFLANVSFLNNEATGGSGYGSGDGNYCGNAYGGAVYSSGGMIIANNISGLSNKAIGGQYSPSSVPNQLADYVYGGSAAGGAICVAGGAAVTISNGVFSNNIVTAGAGSVDSSGTAQGGDLCNSGVTFLIQCAFSGSQANGAIGGSYNEGGSAMGGSILQFRRHRI